MITATTEVIDVYHGMEYMIVADANRFRCVYINVTGTPFADLDYESEYIPDLKVHGGLTFSGKLQGIEGDWIGWDYNHLHDMHMSIEETVEIFKDDPETVEMIRNSCKMDYEPCKYWSKEQIIAECQNAIDVLNKYREHENEQEIDDPDEIDPDDEIDI